MARAHRHKARLPTPRDRHRGEREQLFAFDSAPDDGRLHHFGRSSDPFPSIRERQAARKCWYRGDRVTREWCMALRVRAAHSETRRGPGLDEVGRAREQLVAAAFGYLPALHFTPPLPVGRLVGFVVGNAVGAYARE